MAMVRQYRLQVAAGRDGDLVEALQALVGALRGIDGFETAALLRDAEVPDIYLFSERWSSGEAYRQGASSLPKATFAALMQTLATAPASASFDTVALEPDG